jgi:transcriptional regulator with XRE-family HTH domain
MKTFLINFSKVLKKLRLEKELSQEEIAHQIGLSTSGYSKIERGESDLNISRIEEIAKIFGLSASQMISMVDKVGFSNLNSNAESRDAISAVRNELNALSSSHVRLQEDFLDILKRLEKLEKLN